MTRINENPFLTDAGLPFEQRERAANYDGFSRTIQPTIDMVALGWEYQFGRIQTVGAGAALTWFSDLVPRGVQHVYYNITADVTAGDTFILDKILANGPASPFITGYSAVTVAASTRMNMIGTASNFTNNSQSKTAAPCYLNENEQWRLATFAAVPIADIFEVVWERYARVGPRVRGQDVSSLSSVV